MSARTLRVATAGAFIIGVALFGAGLLVGLTVPWSLGTTMYSIGALLMGVSRLVAWKYKLPAP